MFWIGISIIGVLLAVALLSLFFMNFNRDPERASPLGEVIVAPADGQILDIVELPPAASVELPKGWFGRVKALTGDMASEPHYLIPIFMNPFNVHVQRAPLPGRVVDIRRRPGKFIMANSLDALENATVETLLETPVGPVKVLQTAGYLVRHIKNYLTPGQEVRVGERLGKIDFGSQVTLLFPQRANIELKVRKGDIVVAGETVIATFRVDP